MLINTNPLPTSALPPNNGQKDPAQYDHLWQKHGRDIEPFTADEQKLLNSDRFNRLTHEADLPDQTAVQEKAQRNQLRRQFGISSQEPHTHPAKSARVSLRQSPAPLSSLLPPQGG
ncbi:hypothetical protein A2T76_11400 [Pseudomonas brenneri]|nr:hypothetical protein A2T76_11400 [Pseudomonas brenneri]